MKFSTKPSRREAIGGIIFLILYLDILPRLISLVLSRLAPGINVAQINFIYFTINFAATTVIFRKYLIQSLKDARKAAGPTLWCAILGYLGSQTLGNLVTAFILRLEPDFANVNDMTFNTILEENYVLMAIGTVALVPVAEELLFRGLIFRGLYDRSPLIAHLASMVLFSAIHVTGYIGYFEPKILLLCFIQYLPVSYCLNFAYRHSGTIVAPILMHTLNNLIATAAMR